MISLFLTTLLVIVLSSTVLYGSPLQCKADIPEPELSSMKNSFIKFITINPATTLEVQIFNANKLYSNNRPPLLFIHATRGSRWSWLSLVQCLLAQNFKNRAIIVPSLTGFGDSQIYNRSSQSFSIEALTADTIQLLDTLNINKAVWIGFSQGSFITYYSASIYPQYVESMVLISSDTVVPELTCIATESLLQSLTFTDRDAVDSTFVEEVSTLISTEYLDMLRREAYKPEITTYQNTQSDWCAFDGDAYIPTLTLKTTLIWGELDVIIPFRQEYVDLFTNNPDVFIIDGIRHPPHFYVPGQIAQIIIDHVEE